MTTNLTMKDIKHIILDKIKSGKNVYGVNGIEIVRILQQEKPKTCTCCEKEKKLKSFYRGRTVCKSCFGIKYGRVSTNKSGDKQKNVDNKSVVSNKSGSISVKTNTDNKTVISNNVVKQTINQQKTEYNKLYNQISGIVDTRFDANKHNVIKKGKKIFGINESINTKDHLIEEILPLCKCDSKTIKKMRRFVEFTRTQVKKKIDMTSQ